MYTNYVRLVARGLFSKISRRAVLRNHQSSSLWYYLLNSMDANVRHCAAMYFQLVMFWNHLTRIIPIRWDSCPSKRFRTYIFLINFVGSCNKSFQTLFWSFEEKIIELLSLNYTRLPANTHTHTYIQLLQVFKILN